MKNFIKIKTSFLRYISVADVQFHLMPVCFSDLVFSRPCVASRVLFCKVLLVNCDGKKAFGMGLPHPLHIFGLLDDVY